MATPCVEERRIESHIFQCLIELNMVFTRRKDNEPNGGCKKEKKQKAKISRKIEDKNYRYKAAERVAGNEAQLEPPEDQMLQVEKEVNKKMNATLRRSEWRKGLTDEKKAEINAREAQRKRESRKAMTSDQKALETKKKAEYRQRLRSPEDAAEHMLRVMERKNIKKMNATLRRSEWRKGLTDEKKAEINAREAQRKRESRKAMTSDQKALATKKKAEYRQRKRQEEKEDPAEKTKSVLRRTANGK